MWAKRFFVRITYDKYFIEAHSRKTKLLDTLSQSIFNVGHKCVSLRDIYRCEALVWFLETPRNCRVLTCSVRFSQSPRLLNTNLSQLVMNGFCEIYWFLLSYNIHISTFPLAIQSHFLCLPIWGHFLWWQNRFPVVKIWSIWTHHRPNYIN